MRNKFIAIILLLGLFSCGDIQQPEYICSCRDLEKVSAYITTNVGPANNKSDEEMEDVIHELWQTGVLTNCHQRVMWQDDHGNINWKKEKLDSCETLIETHRLFNF